jgi:glycyl-tRNA synthetase beta chain
MSHHFLCEVGCEEIPTSAMLAMQKSLDESVKKELQKAKLDYKSLQIFSSPRRLAVLMSGLADTQPDQVFERQGPCPKRGIWCRWPANNSLLRLYAIMQCNP